jgi:two-component system phosphate regulon sensor histidine kinase PhoR
VSRIQLKIIGALSALVVTVVFVTGLLAERGLREQVREDTERSLAESARLVRLLVAGIPFEPEHARALLDVAGEAAEVTHARVTLIAASGRVLADSEVPEAEISGLDDHSTRPEVREALAGRVGRSTRFSRSVKRTLVYVAVPGPRSGSNASPGVIRLSLGLDRADAAVADLRGELVAAGALGLVAALGLAFALSLVTLRPIRELANVVSDIAAGQLGRQLHWGADDERGAIARAINRMAQQMRQQLAAAESERAQLDSVLASMVEGVLVVDAEGRIILANPRLRELLSAWGEVEGRPLPEVFREPEIDRAFEEASHSDELVARELEIRRPHERVLLLHAARFPIRGPRAGTVFVLHDVTDLRRVDKIRRDFIANASHELRTPLTAIQGFADTLASGELDDEQRRSYLEVISRNAQRMSALIEDLLALSRIESGGHELDITEVDVGRIAEMTVEDFAPRFEQAGLTAHLDVRPCPMARADRQAVEQILDNLLSNAARYTNAGGHVQITVEPKDGRVRLSVADDGIGIPEHSRERIFERFYRVDAARSRALGSTGLGLAIVKHLAAKMGGEIRVESELGVGSCFTVTLPGSRA